MPAEITNEHSDRGTDLIATAIYLPLALVVGLIWGHRRARVVRSFLIEGRSPTTEGRRGVLRAPLGVAKLCAALWGGAVVLFFVINIPISLEVAYNVAVILWGAYVRASGRCSVGSAIRMLPISTVSPSNLASTRFIAGEPMNAATKRLTGSR